MADSVHTKQQLHGRSDSAGETDETYGGWEKKDMKAGQTAGHKQLIKSIKASQREAWEG